MPTLSHDDAHFLLDKEPLKLVSGSLCYFRMLPSTWEDRLAKLVATLWGRWWRRQQQM